MRRLIAGLVLLFCALALPWWLTLAAAVVFSFIFPTYVELILVGLMLDLLYGVPLRFFGGFQFVLFASSVTLFAAITFFKRQMRI